MIVIKKLLITHEGKTLVQSDFTIHSTLGMVGQSGSGKSLTLKALLGMLPSRMECTLSYDAPFDFVRGESVGLVPQNPFTSLNAMRKIKDQFFCDQSVMRELFKRVGLDDDLAERYPKELSGGQLQRVVLAMVLAKRPKLLLLDEPTTALDPETTETILDLITTLQKEMGFYLLFISHEIAGVARTCEEIVVLHQGIIVESGSSKALLKNPKDAYTKRLIESDFASRVFRQ